MPYMSHQCSVASVLMKRYQTPFLQLLEQLLAGWQLSQMKGMASVSTLEQQTPSSHAQMQEPLTLAGVYAEPEAS